MDNHSKILIFASGLIVGGVLVSSVFLLTRQEKAAFSSIAPVAQETMNKSILLPMPVLKNISYEDATTSQIVVDVSYPMVTISNHPDIEVRANAAIKKFADDIVQNFKKEEDGMSSESLPDYLQSSITMNWNPELISPEILSIRFNYAAYSSGAAHPNGMSRVFNYDLAKDKTLETKDLFSTSEGDTLTFLSTFSREALKKTMNDSSQGEAATQLAQGTEPTAENFKEVALSKEGLIVIFNPYQVASYAQGTQDILIPKNILSGTLENTVQNALRDAQ